MFAFFFFKEAATTEIYTLSLHDALPISARRLGAFERAVQARKLHAELPRDVRRSEEHTSELQSHSDLVCRLLLEKKKAHKILFLVRLRATYGPETQPVRQLFHGADARLA